MNKKQKSRVIRLATCAMLGSAIVPTLANENSIVSLKFDKQIIGNTISLRDISINGEKEEINGIKIYFGVGYDKASPTIEYKLRGKNYTSNKQQLIIDEILSVTEVEEILESLKITRGNPASFQLSIRLNSGEEEDCVYNPSNGHYYKFIPDYGVTWEQAVERASQQYLLGEQGYLVTLTSEDEQEIFNSLTPESVWLGGSDAGEEGNWKWVTGPEKGQAFTYENWKANEPNNEYGVEHCIQSVKASSGKWNDTTNEGAPESWDGGSLYPTGYIVEFGSDKKLDNPDLPYEDSIVVDTIPPVIEGEHDIVKYIGEELNLSEGVTATDDVDGNITPRIVITSEATTDMTGKFGVTYYVEDSEGNNTKATANVTVLDVPGLIPPVEEEDTLPWLPPVEEPNPPTEELPVEPNPPTEELPIEPSPPTEELPSEPPTEDKEEIKPPSEEDKGELNPPSIGEIKPPSEEDKGELNPPSIGEIKPPSTVDKEELKPPSIGELIPGKDNTTTNMPQTGNVISSNGLVSGIIATITGLYVFKRKIK